MLLDRRNNRWAAVFGILLAIATASYVPYHLTALNGPSGGTWPGLLFGIAAFVLMLFVGLLGFRRSLPAWRLGRPATWMRGHVWLGYLAGALALFHSGFHLGGPLTTAMMWLLLAVTISGTVGLVLQQVLPGLMTAQVKMETIYEQIDHVIAQLQSEARGRVEAVAGLLDEAQAQAVAAAAPGRRPWSGIPDSGTQKPVAAEQPAQESGALKDFYLQHIRPYLAGTRQDSPLRDVRKATLLFDGIRVMLPLPLHETLADLENICEECRQLRRQKLLHHWLHGWLLVHVPLSYALLVLMIVHAVYAPGY
jgi:hypothetical protein